jgi:cyclase
MRVIPVAAVLTLAALPAAAQVPDWNKIEIKAEKVAGNVFMLSGVGGGFSGGNIGVSVGADGLVLVDDKFQPLVPKIEAALKGISDKPVRFVINTHYHSDHSHGNTVFGHKATIIAHDNARKRIQADTEWDYAPNTKAPPQALPVVTFDHQLTVHLNGEEIRGIHVPSGHTDGDVVVHFTGSNVVHMGDDFFNGGFPFIDLEHGGTVKGYVAAVETVLATLPEGVKIIPGHGPLATRADLVKYLAMLKETIAIVQKAIDDGKTADELVASKPFARWAADPEVIPPDFYVRVLYNGLKGIAKNPSFS